MAPTAKRGRKALANKEDAAVANSDTGELTSTVDKNVEIFRQRCARPLDKVDAVDGVRQQQRSESNPLAGVCPQQNDQLNEYLRASAQRAQKRQLQTKRRAGSWESCWRMLGAQNFSQGTPIRLGTAAALVILCVAFCWALGRELARIGRNQNSVLKERTSPNLMEVLLDGLRNLQSDVQQQAAQHVEVVASLHETYARQTEEQLRQFGDNFTRTTSEPLLKQLSQLRQDASNQATQLQQVMGTSTEVVEGLASDVVQRLDAWQKEARVTTDDIDDQIYPHELGRSLLPTAARVSETSQLHKDFNISMVVTGNGVEQVDEAVLKLISSPVIKPGRCLPLAGSSGFVTLQLDWAQTLAVDAISYTHLGVRQIAAVDTAPLQIGVFARKDSTNEWRLVGRSQLDNLEVDYPRLVLPLRACQVEGECTYLKFQVMSNHGSPNWTCLYQIGLHIKIG